MSEADRYYPKSLVAKLGYVAEECGEVLAAIRTILATAVPQPESVECPECGGDGKIPSEVWDRKCPHCVNGRIPAPERTTLEMAEAVVARNAALEAGGLLDSDMQIQMLKMHDVLTAERDRLAAWKESAMAVESEWDCQAIARELDLPLGCSVRRELMPAIKRREAETVERCAKIVEQYFRNKTPLAALSDKYELLDAIRATAPKEPTAVEPRGE